MEAVSAAKMRKAQAQVLATRPYAEQAREVLAYIARLPNIDDDGIFFHLWFHRGDWVGC